MPGYTLFYGFLFRDPCQDTLRCALARVFVFKYQIETVRYRNTDESHNVVELLHVYLFA